MTEFEAHRRHLFGVAYRMLGSVADAEDAVQEAWLRLDRAGRSGIEDLRGWLTTVTGRICLDRLRSAAVRRESYPGEWLPEPLITADPAPGPDEQAELAESVGFALLVVLDRLTPEQRIAFVLHDVFAVPFGEVAAALDVSPDAARQHAARARKAVRSAGPRQAPPPGEHRAVLAAFLAAAREGDFAGLVGLLAPGVVFTSDGGGVVRAALRPVEGAEKVARLVAGLTLQARPAELLADPVLVNGSPGAALWLAAPGSTPALAAVLAVTVSGGRITEIGLVVNPAKLTRVPGMRPRT